MQTSPVINNTHIQQTSSTERHNLSLLSSLQCFATDSSPGFAYRSGCPILEALTVCFGAAGLVLAGLKCWTTVLLIYSHWDVVWFDGCIVESTFRTVT